MPRKLLDWKLKNETWRIGERTLLVGVLNVTPDSEYDEGRYQDPGRAAERALELCEQGADLVEIGAESWRAGSARVSEAEELRRLVPVLKRLRGKLPVPLIVETAKSAVAEKAVEYGAQVLKDPTGLLIDAEMARVANQSGAGLILQHMRGTPDRWARAGGIKDPSSLVQQELAAAISRALRANVPRQAIVIDPGFGLGKRKEHNTDLLVAFDRLTGFDLPVQISPTGKPFHTTPQVDTGFYGALAAAVAAVLRGAHFVRTHDIPAFRPALLVADQLLRDSRDEVSQRETRTLAVRMDEDVRTPVEPPTQAPPPVVEPPPPPPPARRPPLGPRRPRDPRDTRYMPESRPPRSGPREGRDTRDQRDPRDSRGPRDPRNSRGPREPRDPRDSRGPREPRDPRGPRGPRGPRPPRDPRGRR